MAKTITITLSNADLRAMEHDVIDPEQWIRDAVAGKVAACAKRMAQEAVNVLSADPAVSTMPAKPDALIAELAKRGDYKTRKQREADEPRISSGKR